MIWRFVPLICLAVLFLPNALFCLRRNGHRRLPGATSPGAGYLAGRSRCIGERSRTYQRLEFLVQ